MNNELIKRAEAWLDASVDFEEGLVDMAQTNALIQALLQALKAIPTVDPDMPTQQLKLHMGELTAQEERIALAAIRWAGGVKAVPERGMQWLKYPDNTPADDDHCVVAWYNSMTSGFWYDESQYRKGRECFPDYNDDRQPDYYALITPPSTNGEG